MVEDFKGQHRRKIVVFKEKPTSTHEDLLKGHGCTVVKKLNLINGVVVYLPEQASEKALEAIMKNRDVVRVDDDLVMSAYPKGKGKKPSEPPSQQTPWGVNRIDAPKVWVSSTGEGVKVAILDTGIDLDHPDLTNNLKGGYNCINSAKTADDDNGHGTHVAGTVAALNNNIGVVGAAHSTHLFAVKALDRRGKGYLSDVIEGIQWCIENGIKVINMSLGTPMDSPSLHDAIASAHNSNIVVICAAGNDGTSGANYPARYSESIGVSAIDNGDNFYHYSNYGDGVDICAPGVDVYSTYRRGAYKNLTGTSMAAPHVAGACALALHLTPTSTPDEVKTKLKSTAEHLSSLSGAQQGAGLVDAEKLIT
jgi:subtilisin